MKTSETCPCCGGTGFIKHDPRQDVPVFSTYEPCKACQGFGTVLVSVKEE